MKKSLVLLALAMGVTAMASMTTVGSGPAHNANVAAERREARACSFLLKKMSRSADADTWQNRLRAWPCRQRADAARQIIAEASR